jgi:hypothetical protein
MRFLQVAALLSSLILSGCSMSHFSMDKMGADAAPAAKGGGLTDAGNPAGLPTVGKDGSTLGTRFALNGMCGAITRCFPSVTTSDCEQGIAKEPNLGTFMGLSPSVTEDYRTLMNDEYDGVYVQSAISGAYACQVNLAMNLPCTAVANGYNPLGTDPYAGVAYLLASYPTYCGQIF